jgi:hypothetical protein
MNRTLCSDMKTTVLGVITILVAVGNAALSFLKTGAFDFAATASSVAAGYGLIHAKDAPAKPVASGMVRLAPLAFFASLFVGLLCLTSCTVVAEPNGRITKTPDKGLIDSTIESGFRLLDRVFPKPDVQPAAPAPAIVPSK